MISQTDMTLPTIPELSPKQQILYGVLRDGMRHGIKELMASFDDEYVEKKTVKVHLSNMRKILSKYCLEIIYVGTNGAGGWQLFRKVAP